MPTAPALSPSAISPNSAVQSSPAKPSSVPLPGKEPAKSAMSLKIYISGKFYDKEDAKISVYDHGLLYGDGVFEGMRSYGGQGLSAQGSTSTGCGIRPRPSGSRSR